ncbi:bolA family protein [Cavenderia fasciculata]|uniref:BolA family protein n=1 Tax=Cavenderia fasciculata TaxID=261658 RepID=F4PYA2_CACFS|nr:bolA family protein [Cavenderia fasciculata]EGG19369.1 bolA family protein [Cavenderia fasciculata]|eukprot:XP_004357640.1 bolA family protein [Cavenderia fasciculata]
MQRLSSTSSINLLSRFINTNRNSITTSSIRYFSASSKDQDAQCDPKGEKIKSVLQEALNPTVLEVLDMSGGCGSMYRIEVESHEFKGKSTLQQHKRVNQLLKEVIPSLHGLTLFTRDSGAPIVKNNNN